MNSLKKREGITLIALVITIIVLIIISGISITQGTKLIEKVKAETIETNMLTIKAKAKEYMESVDSLNWAKKQGEKEEKNQQELTGDKYQLTLMNDVDQYIWCDEGYTYYQLEKKALDKMDLPDLYEDGKTYVIKYPTEPNTQNLELDIIYANGIKYKNKTYYSLSDLQNVL